MTSSIVSARIDPVDKARLAALSAFADTNESVLVRGLIEAALDRMELAAKSKGLPALASLTTGATKVSVSATVNDEYVRYSPRPYSRIEG